MLLLLLIGAGAMPTPPENEPSYQGDAYAYDSDGATGSINDGTVMETETTYA